MRSATPHASEATVHNIDLEHVYQLSEVHKAWLAQLPKQVFGTFSPYYIRFVSIISSTAPATPVSGPPLQELHRGEDRREGNASLWNMSTKTEFQEKPIIFSSL